MKQFPESERARVHAGMFEVLPRLFIRMRLGLPLEIAGLGRITPEQFAVLKLLRERGPQTIGGLAAGRAVALNTASTLADRLAAAGLVVRAADPQDRRLVRVSLTPLGTQLLDRLVELRRQVMREMLEELSDAEINALGEALPAMDRLASLPAPERVAL